jgi:hypothetical protein
VSNLPNYAMPYSRRSENEQNFLTDWEKLIGESPLTDVQKFSNFPMYAARQDLARFLFRAELFRNIVNVHGSVIECGVAYGGGLMAFAQLSATYEPTNYTRKIIGFDTFAGFPSVHAMDRTGHVNEHAKPGAMSANTYDELMKCAEMYDRNRPLGHLKKVELVRGDISQTAPKYIEDNPHLVVSLLYLDADLYEPTLAAIKAFLPRMPKGAIIAFDEVNHPDWPGETLAMLEGLDIRNLELVRVPYDTTRCYARL